MNTKRLIERFVEMARSYSKDAREANLKDRANPDNLRHFYNYLEARRVRRAYMYCARLVKEEQESAAQKMRSGKAAKRWLRSLKEGRASHAYPPHQPNNLELHEKEAA